MSVSRRGVVNPRYLLGAALALAARRCRLGLFLLRLFDFLLVSVVAFGHNNMRVVDCALRDTAGHIFCKQRDEALYDTCLKATHPASQAVDCMPRVQPV